MVPHIWCIVPLSSLSLTFSTWGAVASVSSSSNAHGVVAILYAVTTHVFVARGHNATFDHLL